MVDAVVAISVIETMIVDIVVAVDAADQGLVVLLQGAHLLPGVRVVTAVLAVEVEVNDLNKLKMSLKYCIIQHYTTVL